MTRHKFETHGMVKKSLKLLKTIINTFQENVVAYEIPALVMVIMVPATGYLADLISSKTSLSNTQIRKYYICGGLLIELLVYLPSLYLDKNSLPFLFDTEILDMICYSFTISGYFVNHLDIAPMYACIIISISNLFGTIVGGLMAHGVSHKPFGIVSSITKTFESRSMSIYLVPLITNH